MDIKCRKAGLAPDCVVVVATVRAMKMNGGVAKADLGAENVEAVTKRLREPRPPHREPQGLRRAGRGGDQPLRHRHRRRGRGGEGLCADAGRRGVPLQALGRRGRPGSRNWRPAWPRSRSRRVSDFRTLYPDEMGLFEKIETIAKRIYRADEVVADGKIRGAAEGVGGAGLRRPARLHGQDPVFASRPIRTCAARPPGIRCRCARCGCRPGPGSSWRSAGRS